MNKPIYSTRPFALATAIVISCAILSVHPAAAQYDGAIPPPESFQTGFDSITDDLSRQRLSILAGETFAGRGTGDVGYTKAAHWVAGQLAEMGWEPVGDGGTYFQMLPMSRVTPDMSESRITGPDNFVIEGADRVGFNQFGETPEVLGQLVILKLGDDAPAFEDNNALRDKVVLVVASNPPGFRSLRILARQQPAAIIQIAENPTSRSQIKRSGGRRRANYISAQISPTAAQDLLDAIDGDPSWIDSQNITEMSLQETDHDLSVTVRIREEAMAVPNVIAWMPGSDPEVNHQYVTLGAHLDHLGTRNDQIFNGADDNGSGSTALLNVADALMKNPVKPRRSVLLIWFAAEEIGLVGSRHYCDNPVKPLEDMVCMLNMDMVGRNEETDSEPASENEQTIHLIGSKQGNSGLHDLILDANQFVSFEFEYDQESVFGRSDQANFYRKGIPVAFLFGGFHPNYHRATDTVEKINFAKITAASRLFYITTHLAADHQPFKLQEESETD